MVDSTANPAEKPSENDGLLDVAALVKMFEDSEEATSVARADAERDRDYYDNIQWTAEEAAALKKRGQPATMDNRIKTKVDYLVGLEMQQRIDPRALPRTPQHEEDANAASQALKYVADSQDYDKKRSAIWRNLLIEGCGGISVAVEQGYDGQPEIVLRRWAWDRMFYDPHSSEVDFSDAGYLGGVVWMDYADAIAMYPDAKDILDNTMSDRASISLTYDDKPKFRVWADSKRKRVRICQIWIKRANQWHFAEFTKGGILKAGASPYKDDKGESDCEMIFSSAYVNRDNERYGLVREMISLQDSINKRSSKALHLLSVAQTIYEDGTIEDVELFRRERARPDGTMKVAPGAMSSGAVKTEFHTDLAASHFQLLQDAKNSIDLKGPNGTMMGDNTQGSSAASGRAIIASQQGGMIQLGDLLDHLRDLDRRVFRAIWNRIRQYWTAEKWVRITDEEKNVRWVGVNVDPMQVQMAMQNNPEMAQRIQGVVKSVAELDCDIIIDEVPDSVTPALEQWQGLVELAKAGIPIPPKTLIKAAPNLKEKDQLIEDMEQAAQNQAPDPEIAKAQAQLQIQQQSAQMQAELDQQKAATDAQAMQEKAMIDGQVAQQKAMAEIQLKREVAAADIQLQREKAQAEIEIEQMRANAGVEIDRSRAEVQAQIAAKKASEKPKKAEATA